MRSLVYFISMSLDGYIAGPNDEVDFYAGTPDYMDWMLREFGDALPSHAREALGLSASPPTRFDTVLMGRRTYEPALAEQITSPYAHLRQIVFSRTLSSPDDAVEVTDASPGAVVRELKAQDSGLDLYLAGGGQLAGALLADIDQLVIKRYPVVAGAGRPAFGPDFRPTAFELEGVQTFDGGNSVATYRRPQHVHGDHAGHAEQSGW